MIKAVVFDFGGVLAGEGFREGLKAIGLKNGLNPNDFFKTCEEIIYKTGYVTGLTDEHSYWNTVRERTGIKGDDEDLRKEILERFILRPAMFGHVEKLKASNLIVAILSDQTNWLEEINKKTPFYRRFDHIFNSFKIKKSKRDPSVFRYLCLAMGLKPDEVLFVDDNIGNIRNASNEGLKVIHFTNIDDFEKEVANIIGI